MPDVPPQGKTPPAGGNLTPEIWVAIRPFIEDALSLPVQERRHFLKGNLPDRTLCAAAMHFVELDSKAEALFPIDQWKAIIPGAPQGEMIGNFRILSELGRGGMGAVFLAERANDDDLTSETAQGYSRIGQVYATPNMPSMSNYAAAEMAMQKGIVLQQQVVARHPQDYDALGHLLEQMRHYAAVSANRPVACGSLVVSPQTAHNRTRRPSCNSSHNTEAMDSAQ